MGCYVVAIDQWMFTSILNLELIARYYKCGVLWDWEVGWEWKGRYKTEIFTISPKILINQTFGLALVDYLDIMYW